MRSPSKSSTEAEIHSFIVVQYYAFHHFYFDCLPLCVVRWPVSARWDDASEREPVTSATSIIHMERVGFWGQVAFPHVKLCWPFDTRLKWVIGVSEMREPRFHSISVSVAGK
jgi:hypothetical protein